MADLKAVRQMEMYNVFPETGLAFVPVQYVKPEFPLEREP